MTKILEMNEISLSFGKESVLKNINLSVERGEIFGLLGPSGAGKTTLVKVIVGIIEADKGTVFVQGNKMPSLKLMRSIGYMSQSDALYHELSAKENLDFFATLYGLKKKKREKIINKAAEIVNLSEALNKEVRHYSGGMKRRLSLAASFMHTPRLLILDEPTVGIDPVLRQSIWEEFRRLKESGVTIIVTTHVMDEADKCDRLAMLRDGSVIACDTPEKLKAEQTVESIEEAFLAYGGGIE
ncbi:ATP-binding cassette domain-containing protein [Gracilibacillus salitolerans]|uniref:ATP-binding cassette domain-containing protein n=1 Tax=Gracilibacillus salitolerans TaxID=2663022 RepID=A0A5Q2TEX9_9BACI|nr:ABC transporter ATP-binding protein [Gracilibacillus salitolerans]QGH33339.1 ATP-binding cassette domain-containing protein [Gracilibacillus salitolerans]